MNKEHLKILEEARENWRITENMLSDQLNAMLEDIRFSIGNSDNNYQWDSASIASRKADGTPFLTMNKFPQFINQVVNDARENPPNGKVRPVDSGADKDAAEILMGLIRNIENVSQADIAKDTALEYAARCGMGYFRICTKYEDEDSFNQQIIYERIADPLSVRLDPFYTKADGGDARWGFIESIVSKKQFDNDNPDIEDSEWEGSDSGWYSGEGVRIVEYFRVVESKKDLHMLEDGSTAFEGEVPEGATVINTRKARQKTVKWYKLTWANVIEESEIKCSEIPIYPVVGNEVYVEGKPIRSGMVTNSKDSQRMYNFWASSEAEQLAMSSKSPYIGYAGQFKDPKWKTANTKRHAYLEVEPLDINGNQVPLPQRQPFAGVPTGIVNAKGGANQDIRETIGMYNASIGANSPETSGRAILAKQREGDTGTYHYRDNLGRAIARSYRNIIEMIPKYYDVKRVARVIGEDGTTSDVIIDPESTTALQKVRDNQNKIKRIFNPNVGKYDVVVTIGASYATQRLEAAESQLELAKVIPQIGQVAPDLMARSFDFKGAEEIADRLKSILPPGVAQNEDDEPMPPQVQQAIQQVQETTQVVQQQMQAIAQKEQDLAMKEAQISAEEQRLAAEKAIFEANKKLAQVELQRDVASFEQQQQSGKAEAQINYTQQLEDMVQQLSTAIEENDDEEAIEVKSQENALLAESIAKLTEITNKLANPVKKVGKAIRNQDGSVTMEVVELPTQEG